MLDGLPAPLFSGDRWSRFLFRQYTPLDSRIWRWRWWYTVAEKQIERERDLLERERKTIGVLGLGQVCGDVVVVVAEMWGWRWWRRCGGGGGGGDVESGGGECCVLKERRGGLMSAWGRGREEVKDEKCFRKTNKLQDPKVCACLRDADISGQKCFWPKNK
ncbi:hypothetical protein Hanom_Chr00s026969g01766611 [Helianthus anomalus]